MACSSRSRARLSGFWLENPSWPNSRQTCTGLKRTPKRFSMRDAHPLERPELGAEAVRGRSIDERLGEPLLVLLRQTRRPATTAEIAQRLDSTTVLDDGCTTRSMSCRPMWMPGYRPTMPSEHTQARPCRRSSTVRSLRTISNWIGSSRLFGDRVIATGGTRAGTVATVVSNGLWCFGAVQRVGAERELVVTGGGKASIELPQFRAVNTFLGNLSSEPWAAPITPSTCQVRASLPLHEWPKRGGCCDTSGGALVQGAQVEHEDQDLCRHLAQRGENPNLAHQYAAVVQHTSRFDRSLSNLAAFLRRKPLRASRAVLRCTRSGDAATRHLCLRLMLDSTGANPVTTRSEPAPLLRLDFPAQAVLNSSM